MTLMRFAPFREFDRLAEQTISVGARALHGMPMEALRRGDEASKARRVVLGSAERSSDAPNVVAGSAPVPAEPARG